MDGTRDKGAAWLSAGPQDPTNRVTKNARANADPFECFIVMVSLLKYELFLLQLIQGSCIAKTQARLSALVRSTSQVCGPEMW